MSSTDQPYRVMFVCIGNSCRSPMAEAIAQTKHPDIIDACSSGVAPASIIQPSTLRCLEEKFFRLDAEKTPQKLQKSNWREMDVIVNMSGSGILPFVPGFKGSTLIWEVADPMGQPMSAYRSACDVIERHVDKLATMLRRHRGDGSR